MSLRTKLAVAFMGVVALGVGASLLAAERYLAFAARASLKLELEHAAEVYATFLSERGARRAAEARVVAEEPRLKAAVRTLDIDQATLEDVADELRKAAGADLFVLTDRAGQSVADVSRVNLGALAGHPEFTAAAQAGGAVSLWQVNGQLYQSAVRAMRFGTEVNGFLVAGYQLSNEVLASARAQTGCEVAVVLDGKLAGSAAREGLMPNASAALISAGSGSGEVQLGDERFVILKGPHPGYAGAQLVLARSLDEALVAHAAVRKTLALIGAATLLFGLGAALVLARGLTRRLERLSAGVAAVGRGEQAVKVAAEGTDEVGRLAGAFNQMTVQLEQSRAALVHKERLEKEMQIAQHIQTALLPQMLDVPGYKVAAAMLPAESVGGDLYDVQVAPDGHVWICIGDVTSHGVTPGLIMMMVQSAFSALVHRSPDARPSEVLVNLNKVIYANVRERLHDDNYLTLTLLRSDGPGRFVYSGAHLDLLVRRVSGSIDRLPTPGLWVGVLPDISGNVEESTLDLAMGDVLLLYSDGLTEARDAAGKQFDLDGVMAVMASTRGADAMRDALMAKVKAYMVRQEDDVTVVAVERLG
jgi:sigma-B regulation protein RsbU (phosphoserine phosphatase)